MLKEMKSGSLSLCYLMKACREIFQAFLIFIGPFYLQTLVKGNDNKNFPVFSVPEPATRQLKYVGVVGVPYYKDDGKLRGARLARQVAYPTLLF